MVPFLRRRSLQLWSCIALSSCSTAKQEHEDQVLGWVQDTPIHRSVVEEIATRKGVPQQEALELAADTLRLYFAHQESPTAKPLPEALVHLLKNQSATRLWLRHDFQATYDAHNVPRTMLDPQLEAASKRGDPFRPKLHRICQVVVRPRDSKTQDAREIPNFARDATQRIEPLHQALERALADLKQADDCKLFTSMAQGLTKDPPPGLTFKPETMVIDLTSPSWDRDFTDQVSPVQGPTLLPPFMTRFGLHLVYVPRVFEEHLAARKDGTIAPDIQEKREAHMRNVLAGRWRNQAFTKLLEDLRNQGTISWESPRN